MERKTRILIALGIVSFLVFHIFWINWLFPRVSFAAIVAFPVSIGISLGAGAFIYGILKVAKSKVKNTLVILAIVVLVMFFQVSMHPTASSDSLFGEASEYWDVFWGYPDNVQYEDQTSFNAQKRVAAIVKYGNPQAGRVLRLEIYNDFGQDADPLWSYNITYQDDMLVYDTNKLQVIDEGDETLLIFNPGSSDEIEYRMSTNLETVITGMSEALIATGIEGDLWLIYSVQELESNQKFETGAEKLFAFSLRLLK